MPVPQNQADFSNFSCSPPASGSVRPQNFAATNRAALRTQIADRIVRDIALLDLLDGNPDFEPTPWRPMPTPS